jgi:5-(carboxyamino)imidazole ribonucleotide synthase
VSGPESAEAALATLNGAPAIAEGFVPFTREISVIAARGRDGAVAAYDPGENVHATASSPPPRSPRRSRRL